MGAPTNPAYVIKVLANSEPSTYGGKAETPGMCSKRRRTIARLLLAAAAVLGGILAGGVIDRVALIW